MARKAGITPEAFKLQATEILIRGLVEANLILGINYSSSHGQNFRFVLDKNFRLTGKLRLLDLTDIRPIRSIWERNGQHKLLADWERFILSVEKYKNAIVGRLSEVHQILPISNKMGISTDQISRLFAHTVADVLSRTTGQIINLKNFDTSKVTLVNPETIDHRLLYRGIVAFQELSNLDALVNKMFSCENTEKDHRQGQDRRS